MKKPTMAACLKTLGPAVNELLLLKTAHQAAKEEITQNIDAPLLNTYQFKDDRGQLVTDLKLLYLVSDDVTVRRFYDDRAAMLQAARWPVQGDYCPVCILDFEISKAERRMLDAMGQLVPGISADLCSQSYHEHWKQAVELGIKLVTNATGFVAPKITETARQTVARLHPIAA